MSKYVDVETLIKSIDESIFDVDDNEWMKTVIYNAPSIDIIQCEKCIHIFDCIWSMSSYCGLGESIE